MCSPYRNLRHGGFRLLTVMKGAHDRDLRFQFKEAVPSLTQQYTAISYTWGNDAQTETIHVDGHPLRIKPNLWACLYTLRRYYWQYIWADAICINQDDVTEKNQQVRMMDQIYRNATVVSVWLGLVPLPDWLNVSGPIVTLEIDDFDWAESMEDLANRPYWTRSWTIQEYMLAREIHVYCSNSRVEGPFFQELLARAAGIDLLSIKDDGLAAQSDLIRKWPALPINFGRHVDRMPELYQPLYDLLIRHGNAQSKDPRDKVFALLGLVPREEQFFLLKSFPDYSLSMEQVNAVTLSHLQFFAVGQPLEPIFRALRIHEGRDRRRLLQILGRMDYIGADDPASEVAFISAYLFPHMNEDPEAAVEEYVLDGAVTYDVAQGRNISGIMKCVGGAVVGIPLLCVVAIRLWR
ncbi:uncharacterized protein Z518_10595 [Rhinocladiella mackenziei CBS 650.93]|uniref:Heterokaryon incompatibility domain-containing protein n=1 Tax=Rhinocladiella mackenziei CBS 650.93 TaxID=1442369 RepID=A0A0D2IUR1_9EURO|nr:uncharacterized protein Z518_10595 [Rhinocladiella mackenziei CBS 650.93]KIX00455.1 hypothetical protein Z518_10595 [Rhinocladiella mackenziei CBS 650.93]